MALGGRVGKGLELVSQCSRYARVRRRWTQHVTTTHVTTQHVAWLPPQTPRACEGRPKKSGPWAEGSRRRVEEEAAAWEYLEGVFPAWEHLGEQKEEEEEDASCCCCRRCLHGGAVGRRRSSCSCCQVSHCACAHTALDLLFRLHCHGHNRRRRRRCSPCLERRARATWRCTP